MCVRVCVCVCVCACVTQHQCRGAVDRIVELCAKSPEFEPSKWIQLLGAFAELRKATGSFMYVRLSAWNNSAPTRRIFMKFDILVFFESLSRKFKFH